MSDIYLQITETPTVVTLSAPVVSGALASTVTVANVVTVALDSNSLSALENVTVTVGAAITGTVTVSNFPATQPISIASVTVGNSVTIASLPALVAGTAQIGSVTASISGGVTANLFVRDINNTPNAVGVNFRLPVSITDADSTLGSVGFLSALQDGEGQVFGLDRNFPITGSVTLGAGTAQIGSVTASISGTVPVSGTFFQGTQPVSLTTLPALVAGTAQIGSVTASISGTVPISISSVTVGNSVTIGSLPAISGTVTANTFALQGTAVTTSNFTSTTASTVLANYNASRGVLSIFNEGAGLLFVCPGATCTTVQYQVRLSSGDYWEAPNYQSTITHSAVFQTAGTARVTEVI